MGLNRRKPRDFPETPKYKATPVQAYLLKGIPGTLINKFG
jgi:hypothetical protein